MTDHETVLLLAGKQIAEPLTPDERADLDAHLATCPECRATAAAMRRDDIWLRAELSGRPVAPRVRRRVLEEARGRGRLDSRLVLLLAAALALAAVSVPLIPAGRPSVDSSPSPSPVTAQPSSPAPTPSPSPLPSVVSARPVASPPLATPSVAASPSRSGGFVVGQYTSRSGPPRRDTIAAHFERGKPVGEWSRTLLASGGNRFAGPVTCLVISGRDAWMAGPASSATDGSSKRAALIYVHDGGPKGRNDTVELWLSNAGETLTTMTEWCERRFIPAGPYPLTSGDVVVRDGPG